MAPARVRCQSARATIAATTSAISPADLRTRLYLIADDSMRGRLAGSASDYARDGVHRVGARAGGARARGENGGWFQVVHFRDRGGTSRRFPRAT